MVITLYQYVLLFHIVSFNEMLLEMACICFIYWQY